MNLVGKLAGKQGNRVKAIRLRGVISQGLCLPLEFRKHVLDQDTGKWNDVWVLSYSDIGAGRAFEIGDDVQEYLGITKYEPKIPTCMNGEVFNAFGCTPKFDIENLKKWPDVIQENEEVVITEKLHGTWCCFGYHPDVTHPIVTSKGLSDKGLAFKFNDANKNNLYIKALEATTKYEKTELPPNGDPHNGDDIVTVYRRFYPELTFYILGEIYGVGVQDLNYGGNEPSFRAFDIYIGEPGKGHYMNWDDFIKTCERFGIPTVPLLYKGPYDSSVVTKFTTGKETVSGTEACIREGIVIKPITERRDPLLSRVILKSVSDAYLTRKNATEYN